MAAIDNELSEEDQMVLAPRINFQFKTIHATFKDKSIQDYLKFQTLRQNRFISAENIEGFIAQFKTSDPNPQYLTLLLDQ